jgi:hypothetical protein
MEGGILEGIYRAFSGGQTSLLATLIIFTCLIAIYSLFVYYFHLFLARKNLLELNLNNYNSYEHPSVARFFAGLFYILEYLILLPIFTFFWFGIFSILVLTLSEGLEISTVLLVSAAFVASVRITSYLNFNLSKDIAKLLPLTLLAVAITKPGFFNVNSLISRITEIPAIFSDIISYLVFIMVVELIMRLTDTITGVFDNSEEEQ